MRTRIVLACLAAGTLLLLGCLQENQPLQPGNAPPLDGSAKSSDNSIQCADPLPGGYYSFRWEEFAYSGFERISTRTGAGTVIWHIGLTAEEGVTPLGLAFDLDGTMYTTLNYMSFVPEECWSQFAKVDGQTGAVTRIGPVFPMNTCGGDIDKFGNYYVTGMDVPHLGYIHGDGYLYRFDKHTGVATQIGYTGMTDWMDMAFDSHNRLYATTQNKLFRLDTETGAGTFVANISPVPDADPPHSMEVMSIAFDDHDVLYGTAMTVFWDDPHGSPVFRINAHTGAATLLGYTDQYYNHGGDIYPTTVRVCHRMGRDRFVELTIPITALPAHRAHGDIVPGVDTAECGCPGGGGSHGHGQ
jgi:hypothetical protein